MKRWVVLGASGVAVLASTAGAWADEVSASDLANACIEKLAEIANRPVADIAATAIAANGNGQVVTLDLAGAENPWLCNVDADGTVVDVIYQGEG
jgi:hypothetical protein